MDVRHTTDQVLNWLTHDMTKHILDTASFGTVLATLAGWMPAMAASASLLWTLIRIYETKTVQAWVRRDPRD